VEVSSFKKSIITNASFRTKKLPGILNSSKFIFLRLNVERDIDYNVLDCGCGIMQRMNYETIKCVIITINLKLVLRGFGVVFPILCSVLFSICESREWFSDAVVDF
jgi:hypothetical protein